MASFEDLSPEDQEIVRGKRASSRKELTEKAKKHILKLAEEANGAPLNESKTKD